MLKKKKKAVRTLGRRGEQYRTAGFSGSGVLKGYRELEPGQCLAIEDSPNGVRSAYNAGVKVVMVPDLTGPTDELRRMCRVADRIEEVMEYLKK